MAKETLYEGIELHTDPNLPPWLLSPKEEKLVFQRWRTKAFQQCDAIIKKYIECSNSYSNPIEAMVKCKGVNEEQMNCVKEFQKLKYLDIERDILVKEKIEKRKKEQTQTSA